MMSTLSLSKSRTMDSRFRGNGESGAQNDDREGFLRKPDFEIESVSYAYLRVWQVKQPLLPVRLSPATISV